MDDPPEGGRLFGGKVLDEVTAFEVGRVDLTKYLLTLELNERKIANREVGCDERHKEERLINAKMTNNLPFLNHAIW